MPLMLMLRFRRYRYCCRHCRQRRSALLRLIIAAAAAAAA